MEKIIVGTTVTKQATVEVLESIRRFEYWEHGSKFRNHYVAVSWNQHIFSFLPVGVLCPNSFPYAFMWGEYCCKTSKECDETTALTLDSVCCEKNEYQVCSDTTGCKNNRGMIMCRG